MRTWSDFDLLAETPPITDHARPFKLRMSLLKYKVALSFHVVYSFLIPVDIVGQTAHCPQCTVLENVYVWTFDSFERPRLRSTLDTCVAFREVPCSSLNLTKATLLFPSLEEKLLDVFTVAKEHPACKQEAETKRLPERSRS